MIEERSKLLERYLDSRLLERLVSERPSLRDLSWAVYTEAGLCKAKAAPQELTAFFPDSMGEHELHAKAAEAVASGTTLHHPVNGGIVFISPIAIEAGTIGYVIAKSNTHAVDVSVCKSVVELMAEACAAHVNGRQTSSDLGAELTARYEELALVYQMSEFLNIKTLPDRSVRGIIEAVSETFDADHVILHVPRLGMYYAHPEDAQHQKLSEQLLERTLKQGGAIAMNDAQRELSDVLGRIEHVVAVPVEVDGDRGVFAIGRENLDSRFFMGDVKLLKSISRQVEIFLTNTKVVASRRQLFDLTIFGLARLAESRDPETGEHLERVGAYCHIIATALHEQGQYRDLLNPEYIETIGLSSSLHDIGKVGVPDSVLRKPGKLTDEEFAVMKEHAKIGGDTLHDIEKHLNWGDSTFLSMGRNIAYYHHERWDGSGYPHGIANEDIPICARIMALADVYDALTSKRCYKDAFPHAKAAAIIRESSGTHFDPQIVAMFDMCEALFVAARERINRHAEERAAMAARED